MQQSVAGASLPKDTQGTLGGHSPEANGTADGTVGQPLSAMDVERPNLQVTNGTAADGHANRIPPITGMDVDGQKLPAAANGSATRMLPDDQPSNADRGKQNASADKTADAAVHLPAKKPRTLHSPDLQARGSLPLDLHSNPHIAVEVSAAAAQKAGGLLGNPPAFALAPPAAAQEARKLPGKLSPKPPEGHPREAQIVFMGTGSAEPQKYRGASAIHIKYVLWPPALSPFVPFETCIDLLWL